MRVAFQAEQDRIQGLCARITALLNNADQPGPMSIGPVRDEIAAILVEHMKFKEAMIYRPLRQSAHPMKMAAIGHLDELCQRLYADYVAHRESWTSERIVADWTVYKAITLELIERLDRAIALERVHLYPLLTND